MPLRGNVDQSRDRNGADGGINMINHDDNWKLTAYALGELDETERAEIEARIAQSDDLHRIVDETRALARRIESELRAEPTVALSDEQRANVQEALAGDHRPSSLQAEGDQGGLRAPKEEARRNGRVRVRRSRFSALRYWIPTALAASIALAGGTWYFTLPELARSREVGHEKRPLASANQQQPGADLNILPPNQGFAAAERNAKRRATSASLPSPEHRSSNTPALDPSAQARLAALGYLGGGGGQSAAGDATGNDPYRAVNLEWRPLRSTNHGIEQESGVYTDGRATFDRSGEGAFVGGVTCDGGRCVQGGDVPVKGQGATQGDLRFDAPLMFNAGTPDASVTRAYWEKVRSGDLVAGHAADEGILLMRKTGEPQANWLIGGNLDGWDGAAKRSISFGYQVPFGPVDSCGTEAYNPIIENPFLLVMQQPLSTFSIDVDTASYANVRRMLVQGLRPPADSVRIEEMINYFEYDYPEPTGEHPFSVNVEVAECPWAAEHRLARIGIKGMEIDDRDRPSANLVFLIDVSGSMQPANRLPLVQQSLRMLVGELRRDDSVAMVVYAGASGLVLPATRCHSAATILDACDRLQAGGSTNGGAGIQLAYDTAAANFIEGGINRVILATDGDFNVGVTNQGDLTRLIEEKAKSGLFLTVLGYGIENLKDATLERLADKGNGNYAYIDTLDEARKVLVDQIGGTLVTIAKDVKIQVEFNPAQVQAYRLIGYENRMLAAQDFNDDTKDAGEIGAGHTVTALYEIVPVGAAIANAPPPIDPLKYQYEGTKGQRDEGTEDGESEPGAEVGDVDEPGKDRSLTVVARNDDDSVRSRGLKPAAQSGELMTVKLRYKEPDGDTSILLDVPVTDSGAAFEQASDDFAFAAAVATFGMLLRGSAHTAELDFDFVRDVASTAVGTDAHGYRVEFLTLLDRAAALQPALP